MRLIGVRTGVAVGCGLTLGFAVAACVGDSPTEPGGSDAQVADTTQPDVSMVSDAAGVDVADAAACNLGAPFGSPTEVPGVNSASEEVSAHLSPDELTIWFASARYGGTWPFQLYTATRSARTDAFSTPALVPGASPLMGNVFGASVSGDGLTMVVATNAPGSLGFIDLFLTTRANTAVTFGAPLDMANVNTSTDDETTPQLLATGTALYFARGNGSTSYSIMRSASSGGASFGAPATLNALDVNQAGTLSADPVATTDELTLYFAATHLDGGTSSDIYVARRSVPGDPFGAATPVTELNTSGLDTPHWLSPDGCRLYFATDGRGDGGTGRDLYVAARP